MNRGLRFSLLLVGLLFARSALAYDAYNNFGPSDSYDATTGYAVTAGAYPPSFTPFIQAGRFTAEASGMVAVIRMALHESFHPEADFNQVDVRLHNADASGNIGSIIAAYTRGGLTDFGLSDPPTTITSFDPAVTLTAGNQYWIVVAPGDGSTDAVWNWDAGAGGLRAVSTNSGLSYSYLGGRLGAMRIEVIPEPATHSLLLLAIVIVAYWNRHKR
jgi:hypothetical protein